MIQIPKKIFEQMIEHAKKGYPNEACGVLSGATLDKVSNFHELRNLDESPVSYFIEPKDLLLLFKKFRQTNLVMNGIFHSHVASQAYPSQKDVKLALYPEVSYLIVSLSDIQKPVLRSFKIKDEQISEEKIEIIA